MGSEDGFSSCGLLSVALYRPGAVFLGLRVLSCHSFSLKEQLGVKGGIEGPQRGYISLARGIMDFTQGQEEKRDKYRIGQAWWTQVGLENCAQRRALACRLLP